MAEGVTRTDIGARARLGVESNYEEQPLEGSTRTIMAHKASVCRRLKSKKQAETCPLHGRTNHHMRAWQQLWRDDRGVMERICPHGIGHPDPDDPAFKRNEYEGVHGCDRCCVPPKTA